MCFSLTTCCCCISLETGAQFISILGLIIALADTAYCAWTAAMLPLAQIKIITVFIIVGIMALFQAFCACLLIRGVFKKIANFTIPWIVVAWVKSVACLVVATFGIAVLVLKRDVLHNTVVPALTPGNSTDVLPRNTTESVVTSAPQEQVDTINGLIVIIIVAVCIFQAFLLMYFACVVNSRRKEIRDDNYAQYMPVRTDSIRNVYVPITQQMHTRRYGQTA